MLNVAVVRFPGSNCDFDALRAAEAVGANGYFVWHRDTDLGAGRRGDPARRASATATTCAPAPSPGSAR